MRISKDTETRRQEILEGAIRVFAEKSYDKTSIADIAKELNISQGLCYRYFKSKEEIYGAAIDSYADYIVSENLKRRKKYTKVRDWICSVTESVELLRDAERGNPAMFRFFHALPNQRLHKELSIKVTEKLVPHVIKSLQNAKESGEIAIDDVKTTAIFGLYGAMAIFLTEEIPAEEKLASLRKSWFQLLGISE